MNDSPPDRDPLSDASSGDGQPAAQQPTSWLGCFLKGLLIFVVVVLLVFGGCFMMLTM